MRITWLLFIYSSLNIVYIVYSLTTRPRIMQSLSRQAEINHSSGKLVVGVDEAGRGPLAGPVVAAACFIPADIHIDGIIDSKQTRESDRELTYEMLTTNDEVMWGVAIISHTEIDEINILQASLKAMKLAVESLLEKLRRREPTCKSSDYIALVDGNKIPQDMPITSKFIIKGDSNIFSIAAASIIAKVTRDRIMVELSKSYPEYNLDKHKGYPTLEHRQTLMRLGPTPIHRLSYGPVKAAAEKHQVGKNSVEPLQVVEKSKSATTSRTKRNSDSVEAIVEDAKKQPIKPRKRKVADLVVTVEGQPSKPEIRETETQPRRSARLRKRKES
jgi:ribonuclease HII